MRLPSGRLFEQTSAWQCLFRQSKVQITLNKITGDAMLKKCLITLCLIILALPANAITPETANSCEELWRDNVQTLSSARGQLEEAWGAVVENPDRAAETFVTLRNWQGHDVDYSKCVDVTSLTTEDVRQGGELRDRMLDDAICGLAVSVMSISNQKWHNNREPWMAGAKDQNGGLLFTDEDMGTIAVEIYRNAAAVIGSPSCARNNNALNWAGGTAQWAEKILNDPRFKN